jgi:small multidrug resistance family-3 protein
MSNLASLVLLVLAGLCEIGARYLAWQWLRAGWKPISGIFAAAAIFLSLVLPVLQGERFAFGRSSAAYGALFVVLALLWSWGIDRKIPDRFDLIGAAFCIAGLSIMMYWPRN